MYESREFLCVYLFGKLVNVSKSSIFSIALMIEIQNICSWYIGLYLSLDCCSCYSYPVIAYQNDRQGRTSAEDYRRMVYHF
jgi:hypothetical protein